MLRRNNATKRNSGRLPCLCTGHTLFHLPIIWLQTWVRKRWPLWMTGRFLSLFQRKSVVLFDEKRKTFGYAPYNAQGHEPFPSFSSWRSRLGINDKGSQLLCVLFNFFSLDHMRVVDLLVTIKRANALHFVDVAASGVMFHCWPFHHLLGVNI